MTDKLSSINTDLAEYYENLKREGIYPLAGFIMLVQAPYRNYPARPRAVKVAEIVSLDEHKQGTWIRFSVPDRRALCVLESIEEILTKMERCLTEMNKLNKE